MNPRPSVHNASDREQVKAAEQRDRNKRKLDLADLRGVLAEETGRRLLWRIMAECQTFNSIWEASAKIHYNAGRQDVGHFLQAEIIEADPKLYLLMQQEAMKGENNG